MKVRLDYINSAYLEKPMLCNQAMWANIADAEIAREKMLRKNEQGIIDKNTFIEAFNLNELDFEACLKCYGFYPLLHNGKWTYEGNKVTEPPVYYLDLGSKAYKATYLLRYESKPIKLIEV